MGKSGLKEISEKQISLIRSIRVNQRLCPQCGGKRVKLSKITLQPNWKPGRKRSNSPDNSYYQQETSYRCNQCGRSEGNGQMVDRVKYETRWKAGKGVEVRD